MLQPRRFDWKPNASDKEYVIVGGNISPVTGSILREWKKPPYTHSWYSNYTAMSMG